MCKNVILYSMLRYKTIFLIVILFLEQDLVVTQIEQLENILWRARSTLP